MNEELELEVLEVMEKHGITYDEALERTERMKRQLELASDRQNAQNIKRSQQREKQSQFRQAANNLYE